MHFPHISSNLMCATINWQNESELHNSYEFELDHKNFRSLTWVVCNPDYATNGPWCAFCCGSITKRKETWGNEEI